MYAGNANRVPWQGRLNVAMYTLCENLRATGRDLCKPFVGSGARMDRVPLFAEELPALPQAMTQIW